MFTPPPSRAHGRVLRCQSRISASATSASSTLRTEPDDQRRVEPAGQPAVEELAEGTAADRRGHADQGDVRHRRHRRPAKITGMASGSSTRAAGRTSHSPSLGRTVLHRHRHRPEPLDHAADQQGHRSRWPGPPPTLSGLRIEVPSTSGRRRREPARGSSRSRRTRPERVGGPAGPEDQVSEDRRSDPATTGTRSPAGRAPRGAARSRRRSRRSQAESRFVGRGLDPLPPPPTRRPARRSAAARHPGRAGRLVGASRCHVLGRPVGPARSAARPPSRPSTGSGRISGSSAILAEPTKPHPGCPSTA